MHLGIDIGGTKTEICLVAEFKQPLEVIFRERMLTHSENTIEAFFERLRLLIKSALNAHQISFDQIVSIGVGLPGSIDPVKKVMIQGSVSFFKHIDLRKKFLDELYCNGQYFLGSITFDNDANCFALAETYFGAGKVWAEANNVPMEKVSLVGITLGTGVGGGLIINGNLVRGCRGGAGEIGHVTLVKDGRPCFCGHAGCVEQYLSGTAFEHLYNSQSTLSKSLRAEEIFQRAERNDLIANEAIASYREKLVGFLSDLCAIFDPHVIVLGGGMSEQSKIYSDLNVKLANSCFLKSGPEVVKNHLGGSAGVIGAAIQGYFK